MPITVTDITAVSQRLDLEPSEQNCASCEHNVIKCDRNFCLMFGAILNKTGQHKPNYCTGWERKDGR